MPDDEDEVTLSPGVLKVISVIPDMLGEQQIQSLVTAGVEHQSTL